MITIKIVKFIMILTDWDFPRVDIDASALLISFNSRVVQVLWGGCLCIFVQ